MRCLASLLAFALVAATFADDPEALPPKEHVAAARSADTVDASPSIGVLATSDDEDGCDDCGCDDRDCDDDCGRGGSHCNCFHPQARVLISTLPMVPFRLAPPRILEVPRTFPAGDERDAHRTRLIRPPSARSARLG